VAGAAALLRQLHATWTPAQIKAALMNTAAPLPAPPSLAGAGQLDLTNLATLNLLAYAADGTGGLSYGAPWVAHSWTATQTLRLENTSAVTSSVMLSATSTTTETGVTVTLPTHPISVPANGAALVPVEISIDPSALDFTPDASTTTLQEGLARHYLAEHGGYVQVMGTTAAGGPRVRPAHATDRNYQGITFYLDDQLLVDELESSKVGKYTSTTPGRHTIRVFESEAEPGGKPLVTSQVDVLDGHDYTLILVGHFKPYDLLVVDENSASPPAGEALVHFVNANMDARGDHIGPLDVYLDDVVRVPNVSIGQTSAYVALTPGEHRVAFYDAGQPQTLSHLVALKTFVAKPEEVLLVGSGQYDNLLDWPCEGHDSRWCKAKLRSFVGRGEPHELITPIHVPFEIFPTAASDAQTAGPLTIPAGARSFALSLHNSGARNSGLNGMQATPQTPLASAFELAATSPISPELRASLRAADVQYVGVTSNLSITNNLSDTAVFFGLSSYAPWSTPNEVRFEIYIDANRDGVDDFLLTNMDGGTLNRQAWPSDAFFNAFYPLVGGIPQPTTRFLPWGTYAAPLSSTLNLAPFNSSVMFQAMLVKDLALAFEQAGPRGRPGLVPTSFCYHIETRARERNLFGQVVDRVPEIAAPPVADCGGRSGVLFYDIEHPGIAPINTLTPAFSQAAWARPLFPDVDGGWITGAATPSVLARPGPHKLLILHHHNAPFPRAEVVDIQGSPPHLDNVSPPQMGRIFLPFLRR
jgi:hypothetical protein